MVDNDARTVSLCYLSPQGTTRESGRKIAGFLCKYGFEAQEYDLARHTGSDTINVIAKRAGDASLLVVGSPVYADHLVYPVVSFLKELPDGEGKPALAYVTFGGVSAGYAPYEVTDLLRSRGYSVKGVASILCQHSMMFRDKNPVGEGHPDQDDWNVLSRWIDTVSPRLEPAGAGELDIDRMRPGSPAVRLLNSTVFNMSFMGKIAPRIRYSSEKCTGCGACARRCPAGRLDELPAVSGERCLHCYECVRVCPEGAMDAPMWISYPVIRLFRRMAGLKQTQVSRYRA